MGANTTNWKQIFLSIVLTGIVSLIVGVLLFQYQNKDPVLTYSLQEGIPFESDSESIIIYNLIIANEGKKIIEDVRNTIIFKDNMIDDKKIIAPESINLVEYLEDNQTHKAEIDDLNPDEKIEISYLVRTKEKTEPTISLRGKGIVGTKHVESNKEIFSILGFEISSSFTIAIFTLILFITMFVLIGKSKLKILGTEDDYKQSEDQRETLAYLARLNNLHEEAERYNNIPKRLSYWSESDRIALSVDKNSKKTEILKKKKILMDLLVYAKISKKSKAIIYYNIARLFHLLNDKKNKNQYLTKAKESFPKLIENRLKLDKIW